MKATIPYIEEKFAEFNQAYFGGTLPVLPIRLSDAGRFLGQLGFRQKKGDDGKITYFDFILRINTRMDMSEPDLEDVIIHEMIHYWIGYNQIEDASAHGPMFQFMMNKINETFGRHIEVSHKCASAEEAEQMKDNRERMHMVCVVTLTDGTTALKVVPRIIQRIWKVNVELPNKFNIKKMDWYFTTDPYFNQFPVSTAMKLYPVDLSVLTPYLAKSRLCVVTENSIREA